MDRIGLIVTTALPSIREDMPSWPSSAPTSIVSVPDPTT